MKIEKPSPGIIKAYIKKWKTLDNYVLQESALRKLFTQTYPKNSDLDDVLVKVCSLNDFYSTNIYKQFHLAKHIVALKIDDAIRNNDLEIVNKIAKVKLERKTINYYSFATKYCNHHFPNVYPIYDSFVEKMLMHFKGVDHFSEFHRSDLKVFSSFYRILDDFKKFYGLESFSIKEIDQYLWQAGKKYFKKNYKKEG